MTETIWITVSKWEDDWKNSIGWNALPELWSLPQPLHPSSCRSPSSPSFPPSLWPSATPSVSTSTPRPPPFSDWVTPCWPKIQITGQSGALIIFLDTLYSTLRLAEQIVLKKLAWIPRWGEFHATSLGGISSTDKIFHVNWIELGQFRRRIDSESIPIPTFF